jgi:hypothetical protein
VCSRILSCSLIICCVRVVVPVEHMLSHCCNMCYFIYCSGSGSYPALVSSHGGCFFFCRSMIISLFLLSFAVSECCLVTWLLGAVMLSRVVATGRKMGITWAI